MQAAPLPLLAVVGSLLILAGALGWSWASPLQMTVLNEMGLLRGSVNLMLYAGGGVVVPLLYTWFVTGRSEPLLSARGLAAGVVAPQKYLDPTSVHQGRRWAEDSEQNSDWGPK